MCPLLNASYRLIAPWRVPLSGLCAPTTDGGDCTDGSSGAWPYTNATDCAARCLTCGRCNFVSYSALNRDCSWFHACHTGREAQELTRRHGAPPAGRARSPPRPHRPRALPPTSQPRHLTASP